MGYDECLAFYSAVLRKPDFGSVDADIEWIRAYPSLVGLVCRVRDGDIRQGRVDDVEAGRLLRVGESVGDARECLHDRAGDEVERGDARAVRSGEFAESGGVRAAAEDVGDVDSGGVGVSGLASGRGKNYAKNKAKRDAARARKLRCGGASFGVGTGGAAAGVLESEARASLAAKWKAENELAVLRAQQQAEVLRARDMEQAKRAAAARVRKHTERDLVAIEKAYATLRATDNVPGQPAGFAETVVDTVPELSGGCTISPDSSASQAEFRAMAKRCADLEERLQKMSDMTGLKPDHLDFYEKKVWTDTKENCAILDEMYPEGYVKNDEYAPDGKFVMIPI